MINILPYNQKKSVTRIRALRVITTTLFALSFLIAAGGALLIPILFMINSRFSLASNQIGLLEQSGAVANPVDVQDLQVRVQNLKSKLSQPEISAPINYINTIRKVAPVGISLTGFAMTEGSTNPTVNLAGIAKSREILQAFVGSLEKDPTISSVDSPVSNYVKSSNSQFTITVIFK